MKQTLFPRVLGQSRAAFMLGGFLDSGRIPSSLLFLGPQGTGKNLMALEFARALLCRPRKTGAPACGRCSDCGSIDKRNHLDLAIVDAQYQAGILNEDADKQKIIKVETIRHLRKDMDMHSMLGSWKVAVIEDANALNDQAANALLKILEEPLPQRLWILISSQKERLPQTVPSRCFTIPFSPLSPAHIGTLLAKEGISQASAETLADTFRLAESPPRPVSGVAAVPNPPRCLLTPSPVATSRFTHNKSPCPTLLDPGLYSFFRDSHR